MSPEKLPPPATELIKLLVQSALLQDKIDTVREEAAAALSDEGMSPQQISDTIKARLLSRGDLNQRHLDNIGVSRSTFANALKTYRARQR